MIVTATNLESCISEIAIQPHWLSFDTETYGLLRSDQMFSLIIGGRDMSWYFNFKNYPDEGVESLPREALLSLKTIFADPKRKWYAQNAKFDLWRLYMEGIEVAGEVFCTEAMGRVLKNNHMKYSLAESAKRIGFEKDMSVDEYITKNKLITKVDIPGKDKQLELRHYDRVPFAMISKYGLRDAEITYKLGEHLREEIFKNDKLYTVYLNELELTKSVFEMEKTGVRIDPGYIMRAWRHEERLILEAKEQFRSLTGQEYTTSRATLVQIFQHFGDTVELNENKNYVLDKEALAKLKSPAAKIVQKIRYYEKRISSFYSNFMHFRDSDNIIRPDFRQGGTETGRFSMRDPNLQQLSKKDKNMEEDGSEVFSIRGCFVPRPGTCFVQLDYSQQEYRLMADYANERKLIAKIMSGMDVHQATADLVGISRDQAKTLNFACIAKGQLVLTDKGLVPIENVSLGHKLWDGLEFVGHEGVVYNGEKEVIEREGLTATKDHIIFTECGRQICFGDYSAQQGVYRIATTEVAGNPVRYSFDYTGNHSAWNKASHHTRKMLSMFKTPQAYVRKYFSWANNIVPLSAGNYSKGHMPESEQVANEKVLGSTYSVHISSKQILEKLWRTWNKGFNVIGGFCPILYRKLFERRDTFIGYRQSRQQRKLREGEFEAGNEVSKPIQSKIVPVYDIINCGPRNRFTVSGKLVHNCLYGSGAEQIASMLKIKKIEAEILKRRYFDALPSVENFMCQVAGKGRARGFIFNWLGRHCYLANKDWAYILPNHLIQGSGADVMKVAINRTVQLLEPYQSRAILTVHDSLLLEMVPEEFHLIAEVKKIFESIYPAKHGIVLTCDVEHSWKSLSPKDMKRGEPSDPSKNT